MVDGVPYFYNDSVKCHTTETEFDVSSLKELPKVGVAYFTIDADPEILDYYKESGVQGIVIAGAGSGCYSEQWNNKIDELAETGIPCSSVFSNWFRCYYTG